MSAKARETTSTEIGIDVQSVTKHFDHVAEVTPPGMRRVQADCREGVASLMKPARTLPYVHASTIFGTSLHLLVDERVSNQKIDEDLEAFGISEVTVLDIEPTLEDVFVRLTDLEAATIEVASRRRST